MMDKKQIYDNGLITELDDNGQGGKGEYVA